jgi:hypothetical protein
MLYGVEIFISLVNIKKHTMKNKLIDLFQDVTVWLAWYLIVSTALMAICLVPQFLVGLLCK